MFRCYLAFCLSLTILNALHARQWTDISGQFKSEGQLVALNDELAVIMTPQHRVLAIHRNQLSEADQQYLTSEEAKATLSGGKDEVHSWELRNGMKVLGKIVAYGVKDVTIQRQKAKLHVDGVEFEKIPPVYQKMAPRDRLLLRRHYARRRERTASVG